MAESKPPANIYDALAVIVDALEKHGIEYAVGGALALGVWAEPRATEDIDLGVFVAKNDLRGIQNVLDAFESVGLVFDRAGALEDNILNGMMTFYWGSDLKIEVFPVSYDFQEESNRTKVLVSIGGNDVWFVSPESYAVFKLIFFRPKDIPDLQTLLRDADVDTDYVRRWVVKIFGTDSDRVAKWDELVARRR